jgi:hypothetical protein
MPRATLFVSDQGEVPPGARPASYLSFNARVGHNSRFIGLSEDDYEELGGVEYRALTVLLWIVSGVSTSPLFFVRQDGCLRSACLVLYCHAIDTICSACSLHVDGKMEGQLFASEPTPYYQPDLVG